MAVNSENSPEVRLKGGGKKRDGMLTAALGSHRGTGRDFNQEVLGLDQGGASSEKRAMHQARKICLHTV